MEPRAPRDEGRRLKAFFRFFLGLFFRFRAYNVEALNTPGPVLLIPNHVSWFDWLFLWSVLDGDWRFVTSSVTAQTSWLHQKIMVNRFTFPIDTASPYAVKRMAEFLQAGGRLVLFAEGRLSRTGAIMKLFDGTGFLLFKTKAKVITAYLRGARRLLTSPNAETKLLFPSVSAHFSNVLDPPELKDVSTTEARQRLTAWLRDRLVELQFGAEMEFGPKNLLAAISETARPLAGKLILEDAFRQELTYRKLLAGADLLSQAFAPLLPGEQARIGVLLPNINALPVLLLALWKLGRTPAILNFSSGTATMLTCAQLAGLKIIVSSESFVARARLDIAPFRAAGIQVVFLEQLRGNITAGQKLAALCRQFIFPGLENPALRPDDPATVLFTSGSEGIPKGVELSHRNILANIRQMLAVTDIQESDRVFNCLPLFHSFGITVGTFLGLVRGLYIFIYPSPLHYRLVPTAFYERDCTIFLSTNTFLNGYGRKAHPYDFRSLRYLFSAAEKLQEATALTWSRKFGVRILEGYGATECSPCVSINTPLQPRYGSVGKIVPGMEFRLEHVEGVEEGGRLFVRGPNVMLGYLNPDANAHFKELGGWYDTGDIVSVDKDGYVFVLGRLKRFAKVSGEMVSLTAVEDALAGAFPQYGLRCQVAIVSRLDEDKGEALIAVTNEPKLGLDEIRAAIRSKGMTNLAVPREIKVVREIPKLGTGKVNHRELQKLLAGTS
jgi:acyl-[acyl-carrier-protein]-phospholipid O-acyltransferase/long-chain-fatty-acid--[acyl-carrier-protein] ligase